MKILLSDCHKKENSSEFSIIANKLAREGIKNEEVPIVAIHCALGFDDAFKCMRLVQGYD